MTYHAANKMIADDQVGVIAISYYSASIVIADHASYIAYIDAAAVYAAGVITI